MPSASQALSSLTVGARAKITFLRVPSDQKGRLMEMGVLPGTAVELVRFAPMGDPLEIKVRGYHLTLRKQEADLIEVVAL